MNNGDTLRISPKSQSVFQNFCPVQEQLQRAITILGLFLAACMPDQNGSSPETACEDGLRLFADWTG